jgi:hypothetical protein
MIRIVQHEAETELLEIGRIDAFDGPQRPDRHERRRLDGGMRGVQPAESRGRVSVRLIDQKLHVVACLAYI